MDFIVSGNSRHPFSLGLKLYIYRLLKANRIEFEQWTNGFGLRSSFNAEAYPKQDLKVTFGDKIVFLRFKNSPYRHASNKTGNFCQIEIY